MTPSFKTAVDAKGFNFQRYNFVSNGWEIYSEGDIFRSETQVDLSRTYRTSATPSVNPVMDPVALATAREVAARPQKHHWWDNLIPHFGKH